MKRKTYYQVTENTETRTADINIYGDITSNAQVIRAFWGDDGSRSAMDIKQAIDGLDVDTINVYINSYGGEVAEALAIYSSLQRHKAQIHTYCDGFACSAATIIFCAGDIRTMGSIALMMIHNCMSYLGYANSEEMRKAAEDNDKINQSSIEAYKKVSSLSEDEIKDMMNAETWLTAQECLDYGFATDIADDEEEDEEAQQTAFASIRSAVLADNREAGILSKLDAIQQELKDLKTKEQTPPQKAEKTPQPTEKNNYLKTLFGALYRRNHMFKATTNPAVKQAVAAMQAAIATGEDAQIQTAFEGFGESIAAAVREDFESAHGDENILIQRGFRVLTAEEKNYYQKVIDAGKQPTVQTMNGLLTPEVMPQTIIEDVYKNLTEEHPLLDKINFVSVQYLTRWILNDHTADVAVWGEVNSEITKEITSAFRTVDITQYKLSAFALIEKDMLELGPVFLDGYIRAFLAEALAKALEQAIIGGNGHNKPVGMDRDIH